MFPSSGLVYCEFLFGEKKCASCICSNVISLPVEGNILRMYPEASWEFVSC